MRVLARGRAATAAHDSMVGTFILTNTKIGFPEKCFLLSTSALDILKGSDPDLNKLRRKPWMLPTDETSRNWSSWAWGC